MKGEKYLFVVSGPSGTGKDTVVASLLKKHPEIQHTVSATTRTPREGETDGIIWPMARLSSTPNTAKTTTVPCAARLRAAWHWASR